MKWGSQYEVDPKLLGGQGYAVKWALYEPEKDPLESGALLVGAKSF